MGKRAAATTELSRHLAAQQADRTGFAPHLTIHVLLLVEPLEIRDQFGVEEVTREGTQRGSLVVYPA